MAFTTEELVWSYLEDTQYFEMEAMKDTGYNPAHLVPACGGEVDGYNEDCWPAS